MKNDIVTNDSVPAVVRRWAPDVEWFPAIDLTETSEAYFIEVDIPGLHSNDLSVRVDENVLLISGERSSLARPNAKTLRVERPAGTFVRLIALPEDARGAQVETIFHDGVMELRIPRAR